MGLVPIQYMTIMTVMHLSSSKRFNQEGADLDNGQFLEKMAWLLLDLSIELCTFAVVACRLKSQHIAPLRTLKGALLTHWKFYSTLVVLALMYFLSLQHSHAGCDFEFHFAWIVRNNATWKSGTRWE